MRGLLILVMSLTLAAAGFAQSRGGGAGFRGGARSFGGGVLGSAVRGAFSGGGFGRGFAGGRRTFGGFYGGYGYARGIYAPFYDPYYYNPYYYGAYAPYGYYAPPLAPVVVPRAVIAPRPGVFVGGWRRFGWR
jgi:hypothetical protein